MPPIELLETSPLFAGLSRHALKQIAGALALENWPRNSQIAGPAAATKYFRVVVRGRVKIIRSNLRDGRELTLWLLGPGDGFDLAALLDGEPHAVAAWTLDEVTTLSAPLPTFRRWLERFPPLRLALQRQVAEKLRELTELASDLALHDTSTRLAHLLLHNLEETHAGDEAGLDPRLDLSQQELASLIGSVRVVVGRALAQMRREGIVAVHRGALRIASIKRLLARAEGRLERPKLERPKLERPKDKRRARGVT
jgi:CRP/FNR family transcriptional regulator, cyclic AMP receptor protein